MVSSDQFTVTWPGHIVTEAQIRIDRIVDLLGVLLVQRGADAIHRPADVPVHQVDRMGRVVIEAAAALVRLAAPGLCGGFQHHRTIGLGVDVADLADRLQIQQTPRFHEGADKTIVIADLAHEVAARRLLSQLFADGGGQGHRLFAEDVDALFQGLTHHLVVKPGRRRDHHRVQAGRLQQLRIVRHVGQLQCFSTIWPSRVKLSHTAATSSR